MMEQHVKKEIENLKRQFEDTERHGFEVLKKKLTLKSL